MAPPPVEALSSTTEALDNDTNVEAATPEATPVQPTATPTPKVVVKPKPKAKKSVTSNKQLRYVKLSVPAKNQVQAIINTGNANFKYSARLLKGPQRLAIDLNGITDTATKSSIFVPASAKGLVRSISVEKRRSDSVRLNFNLTTKGTPKYSINRTKNGMKVIFRK